MKIYAVRCVVGGENQPVMFITASSEEKALAAAWKWITSTGYSFMCNVDVTELGEA